jgi:hypothetical protein
LVVASCEKLYLEGLIKRIQYNFLFNQNATIKNAMNVNKSVMVKDAILTFQNREAGYPHALKKRELMAEV